MPRKVFYSFDFENDAWRVSQVKNMGVVEGQRILTSNQFEEVKRGGKPAIKRWIDEQMDGKSCVVVLVGTRTAEREWVDYEIKKAWSDGRGLLGVRVHGLKDRLERTASRGRNPFAGYNVNGRGLDDIVKCYDPGGVDSNAVYRSIERSLASWVEEAIELRKRY